MRTRVLITGATGGLGRAFAWEFASRGWDLYLTDQTEPALAVLADGLRRAHGVDVAWYACDLADEEGRRDLVGRLTADPPSRLAQTVAIWLAVIVGAGSYSVARKTRLANIWTKRSSHSAH